VSKEENDFLNEMMGLSGRNSEVGSYNSKMSAQKNVEMDGMLGPILFGPVNKGKDRTNVTIQDKWHEEHVVDDLFLAHNETDCEGLLRQFDSDYDKKPRWLRTERLPSPMRLCCHKSLVPGLYCLYYWQDALVWGLAGEEWQREYPISLGKVISVEGRWPEKDCKVTVKYCPPSNKKMKGVGSVAQQIMTENSTFFCEVQNEGGKGW